MKSLLVFGLVILSQILFAYVEAQCEAGWQFIQDENKCIKIIYDTIGSRGNAMRACHSANARLLTIHNQATQDFIEEQIKDRSRFYWIGLNDWNKEGSFLWPDGTSTDSYKHWGSGQPDDYDGEDCVHLGYDMTWNDLECDTGGHRFICEKIGPGCSHKNGGCVHACIDPKAGGWRVTCSKTCDKGFAPVHGFCYDIDECSNDNGGCDQTCTNTRGSFRCECKKDFTWDGSKCISSENTLIG